MKKRILAILAAALMLSSCGKTESVQPDTVPATEELTEAPVQNIDYTYADIKIIRPESAETEIITAIKDIKKAISDTYAVDLALSSDWLAPGTEAGEYEILVGNTERPESAAALSAIGGGKYTVRVVNGKLVIAGSTDALTAKAAEYFIENVVPAGRTLPENFEYTYGETLPVSSLKICGTGISDCCIVYKNSVLKTAADELADYIEENAGFAVGIKTKSLADRHEIVFTNVWDGKTLAYADYGIYFKDGKIYITAGSAVSAGTALAGFISKSLSTGGDIDIDAGTTGTLLEYTAPERQEYIDNPEKFVPNWQYEWTPSQNLLDYSEKVASLTQENANHVFTVSHRGDFLHYPENSLESYLSVWKMGGDCLEIDLHFTKDGVAVIMHDATLTRMTDVASYMGKDGYPDSNKVCDWTLEQLKVLRLKEGQGGTSAALTDYRIPTLEECLTVAKGRFFYILDKASEWRYCDIEGIQTQSAARFIYPYMKKTGNFESVLISYGTLDTSAASTLSAADALKIQKYVYDSDGAKMYFFLRCWTGRDTVVPYAKTLTEGSLTNAGLLVNGAFNPKDSGVIYAVKSLRKNYPKSLIGGWTIDSNGYDCSDTWDVMYKTGFRSIMTNNMYALVQWAASKAG